MHTKFSTNSFLTCDILVTPLSRKVGFTLDKAERLRCFVSSAPERGKANNELIELLAAKLRISRRSIQIIAGESSRKKRVVIETELSYEQFLGKLGIAVTKSIF